LRGDNSWKDSHELDQIVIYLEEADLNEKLKGLLLSFDIFLKKR
jgi:hypothetical protein